MFKYISENVNFSPVEVESTASLERYVEDYAVEAPKESVIKFETVYEFKLPEFNIHESICTESLNCEFEELKENSCEELLSLNYEFELSSPFEGNTLSLDEDSEKIIKLPN